MNQFHKRRAKQRRWTSLLLILSLLVASGVVWELRGIGISMTNETDCGIEEHLHSPGCYETLLICGLNEGDTDEDGLLHEHSEACYEDRLICEIEEHVHTIECIHLEETTTEQNLGLSQDGEIGTEEDLAEGPEAFLAAAASDEDVGSDETADEDPGGDETDDEEAALFAEMLEDIRAALLELYGTAPPGTEFLFADDYVLDEEGYMTIMASGIFDVPTTLAEGVYSGTTVQLNQIYVVTAIDERLKDEVHEYLSGIYIDDWPHNANFVLNSSERGYIVHVGDAIELTAYTDSSDAWFWKSDSESRVTVQNIFGYTDPGTGVRKVTARVTANDQTISGGQAQIHFNGQTFYLTVKNGVAEYSKTYTHSDIEVTDGGYYKVTDTTYYGTYSESVVTLYKSMVTQVNHCYLYGHKNGETPITLLQEYKSEDYQKINEVGLSQYELTSQYKVGYDESRHILQTELEYVTFDVDLLLTPTKKTRSRTYYETGHTDQYTESIAGTGEIELAGALFTLQGQSIIDANNKCPNNSGLDFTVISELNGFREVGLGFVDLKAQKTLFDDSTSATLSLSGGEFTFDLLDDVGRVVDTQTNAADGSVNFERMYYLNPGTYHYRIKERIPSGAIQISENVYSYNSILYDGHTTDVSFEVYDDGVSDTLKIINLTYSDGGDRATFLNRKPVTPKVKHLTVSKVWSDGASSHTEDNIKFRIYCQYGSSDPFAIVSEGNTIFQLDAGNGWTRTFDNLPFEIGGYECSYEVEEIAYLGYSASYSTTESATDIQTVITNKKKSDVQINVEKRWYTSDTTEAAEPPDTPVSVTVTRKYKRIPIPVTINLALAGASPGEYLNSYVENAYEGEGFKFRILDGSITETGGSVQTASNCSCVKQSDGSFAVTDVSQNAEITIEIGSWIWHRTSNVFSRGSDYYQWAIAPGSAALFNNCWSTAYTTDGDDAKAVQIYNRTNEWDAALLKLNPAHFAPGGTYSISAYLMAKNKYDGSANPNEGLDTDSNSITFNLTLRYTHIVDGAEVIAWKGIGSYEYTAGEVGNWVHINNKEFQIPGDAIDVYLSFDTSEPIITGHSTTRRTSFYIDDVMLGAAGRAINVDPVSGNFYHYSLNITEKTVPADALNWTADTTWIKTFTLSAANSWKMQIDTAELAELMTRDYKYYAVENSVPDMYKVVYELNGVSANTASTPILIKNVRVKYLLPNTGGYGTRNVQLLGLIFLLAASLAGLYIKIKKRRSGA